MNRILLAFCFCACLSMALPRAVYAQQDAQFTQYMFNQLYLNPAYAGIKKITEITLVHRTQWAAYQPTFDDGGAPATQVFSFSTQLPKLKSGIGIHLVNDALGPMRNLEAQLSYSYHIAMKNNATLSIGLRGGVYSRSYDYSKLRFRDSGDPYNTGGGKENDIVPDGAVGIYYNNPKFFASVSANHLVKAGFQYKGATSAINLIDVEALANSVYIFGGYHININRDLKVTPTLLAKTTAFKAYSFDAGAWLTYQEKYSLGVSYRNQESVNAFVGAYIPQKKGSQKMFRIGYSFDYIITGKTAKQPTSHEVLLAYTIPVPAIKLPPIIRTPRFRY